MILYAIIWIFESPAMSNNSFIFKFIPVPILRGIAGVMLGASLYYFWLMIRGKIAQLSGANLSILEILALIAVLRLVLLRESNWVNGFILIPFAVLILIMFSSNRGIVSRILSNEYWKYLGEISYAFYIMQSFCSNIFTCMCPNVKQPWVFIWYIILNFIVAIIVHELVEKRRSSIIGKAML